jgi:hypothetical protein
MRQLLVGFVALLFLSGCAALGTPTPRMSTVAPTVTQAASVASVSATPADAATTAPATPTRVADTPTPTPSPPQVVTVKGEAVNLRQAADVASAIVTLVPPGTDARVIGEDTTGPDGVTRYVHARVGDKEGYLRSDLVSEPHVATPAPPTAIPSTATRDPKEPSTVVGKNIAMSLYQYYDPAPKGVLSQPATGYHLVSFDVAIGNRSSTPHSYNLLYFYLKTSDNRKYDATIIPSALFPVLSAGTNQAGETTRGWVTFEVPNASSLSVLGYQELVGETLTLTFR